MNPTTELRVAAFHGTRKTFSSELVPSASGAQGPGIYLTDRHETAAGYGTVVIHVNVTLLNPYYFYPSDESLEAEVNPELIEQVLSPEAAARVITRLNAQGAQAYGLEVMHELQARGHDGIVMVYPFGTPVLDRASGEAVIVCFDPDSVVRIDAVPEKRDRTARKPRS